MLMSKLESLSFELRGWSRGIMTSLLKPPSHSDGRNFLRVSSYRLVGKSCWVLQGVERPPLTPAKAALCIPFCSLPTYVVKMSQQSSLLGLLEPIVKTRVPLRTLNFPLDLARRGEPREKH